MTRVKICGITREEDAKQAVALGADALGLVFYTKSPRFVSAEQAAAIAAHIPAFTSVVGLFVNASVAEVEAVLAHEMAHVGNGDMVTLTLIQGVVNTFVVFLARIVSGMVARNDNGEVSQGTYFIVSLVLQIVFGFLASFIVMWFSRQREYRADAGAAKLVGAPKMIAALQRLKGAPSDLPKEMTAMGIASEAKDSLLSTHPTLDNRIERLKQM